VRYGEEAAAADMTEQITRLASLQMGDRLIAQIDIVSRLESAHPQFDPSRTGCDPIKAIPRRASNKPRYSEYRAPFENVGAKESGKKKKHWELGNLEEL